MPHARFRPGRILAAIAIAGTLMASAAAPLYVGRTGAIVDARAGEFTNAIDAPLDKRLPADRVALIIANANYADEPLRQPIGDARALAEQLRELRFDVDLRENLTKEGLKRAIARLQTRSRPGSTALIFFAGYGVQVGGRSYMLPIGAEIWNEADVLRHGIDIEPVLAELSCNGADVKLAILDASRRNPFERRFRSYSHGLAPIVMPPSSLAIFADAPGQATRESGAEHGLLVGALLDELRFPGLSADDIFNRVRSDVARASNRQQVPCVASTLIEDFYFGMVEQAAASTPDAR
jgi:uncharacterized caspase-like protein